MSAAEAAREAARMTDPVEHGFGLLGMMLGAVLGAALVIATGGTGLLFVAALLGGIAAGGLAGGKIARGLAGILGASGITTGAINPLCSPDIILNDLHAARAQLDGANCNGVYSLYHIPLPISLIAEGSDTVFFNRMPAARKGDKLVCGADIKQGSPTVFIGGGTIRLLEVHDPEEAMKTFLEVLGLASIGLLIGGFLAGAVCGTVLLEAAAGMVALTGVHLGVGMIADSLGLDDNWKELLDGVVDLGALGLAARVGRGEPVDVVSGEVMSSTVDFRLPGVLPLVFARTYLSGLEGKGQLGPKWRTTLGAYVEPRDGKIVYEADDGRSLRFPPPALGQESRHSEAPRLALSRAVAGYRISGEGRTLRFEREIEGRYLLTRIEDRAGNTIDLRHDETGALREVIHSGGYRVAVEGARDRIESMRLVSAKEPITLVRYGYDERGRLDAIYNESGRALRYSYDDEDRLVRWVDRNQHWYSYRYDAEGRVVETDGPEGAYRYRFQYDPFGKQSRVVDALGHATIYRYNRKHRVVEEERPDGGVARTTWDHRGNKLEEIDPSGAVTSYAYDAHGNVASVTDPTGALTRFAYDEHDQPVQLVDANGHAWMRRYDERGSMTAAVGPDGGEWAFAYDEHGALVSATSPVGKTRVFENDAAGLPLSETDWAGRASRIERDAMGRVTRHVDPEKQETLYAYDVAGRLVQATLPTGAKATWDYDAEGNLVRFTDPLGRSTMIGYGPFDRVREVLSPGGGKVRYEHDAELRVVRVVNARGKSHQITYDAMGRVTKERDFAGRRLSYAYDAAGACRSWTDARGKRTKVERDAAGRITRKIAPNGRETTFEYDGLGNLVSAKNADAEVQLARDPFGRVVKEVQNGREIASAYDPLGRRTRRDAGGWITDFDHDDSGALTAMHLGEGMKVAFTRDAAQREIARTMSSGLSLHQSHDAIGHVTRQIVGLGPSLGDGGAAGPSAELQRVLERRYLYDAAGETLSVKDSLHGQESYSYDDGGLVTRAEKAGSLVETFEYDAALDIAASTRSGLDPELLPIVLGARAWSYDASDRLSSLDATRYEYDDDGRLTARIERGPSGEERRTGFAWSEEGLLEEVTTPAGEVYRYVYDPLGRRIEKRGPRGTIAYLWDGDTLAEEIHEGASRDLTTGWLFEPGTFRPVIERRQGKDYMVVTDPAGTPRELFDASGEVAWSASYTLWGEVAKERASGADCPLRFQGQYADPESGLSYNRHRYYDPRSGRYVSPDPIGLDGGLRPYGYVTNPLAFVDPFGLVEMVDPNTINFSQRTVSSNVQQYVTDMKAGNWDWQRSGPLRVMNQNGQLVSYDNRRLMAAQQAGVSQVPVEVVNPQDIMPGSQSTWERKFNQRFADSRNVRAGGAVPEGGLREQPQVVCK